ncbi:MAG TPA: LLM class flavin-dependent oxidoreductase [Dehalococcoidia bacterium]|nr:LLM class flavin-dependent oxidoreductase [Dehalococcoidia bacterium]
MGTKRKYWGVISPLPAPILQQQAQMYESAGLEGLFAPQVYGPPFVPLAAAAMATQRVRLASGIALAFVRSPFETATAAMDLDRVSGGRFTLGLGTSVRSWTEGFFGMPYGKPLEHLQEVVELVRTVFAKAHTGELGRYEGKYHALDFSEFQPLGAPLRTDIPIWIAGLRLPLVELAARIADGVIGHPIWSVEWATTKVADALKAGLAAGRKSRDQVEFNTWLFVAPNDDRRQAIEDARATVAFYGGIQQYEAYFEAHGFGTEARRLQEGVKRGDYLSVRHLVTDEMAQTFVVCGTPDEVRKRIEPIWDVADSATLVPPSYGLEAPQLIGYAAKIGELFYQ